jgi:fluoride exporter
MMRFLAVGAGGFLGAIARYAVGLLVARFWSGEFPLATFLINVSGSFAIGLFTAMSAERLALDPVWRLLFATGFVGAYTTFSTFEYETNRLVLAGSTGWAIANVLASVVVGFLALRLGVALAR